MINSYLSSERPTLPSLHSLGLPIPKLPSHELYEYNERKVRNWSFHNLTIFSFHSSDGPMSAMYHPQLLLPHAQPLLLPPITRLHLRRRPLENFVSFPPLSNPRMQRSLLPFPFPPPHLYCHWHQRARMPRKGRPSSLSVPHYDVCSITNVIFPRVPIYAHIV